VSEAGHYRITVVVPNGNQSFTLTATPDGIQLHDQCANLTVNIGSRGYSGAATSSSCW
jgi:type IV pilus assembly protein PilE